MNTLLDKIESLINLTNTSENRDKLTEINITLHKELNLCDGCVFHFSSCKGKDIIFGNGRGNDNVIQCETYKYKD